MAGWLAGWSSDYRATTSSAKSLSVRTSVAISTFKILTNPGGSELVLGMIGALRGYLGVLSRI